MSAWRQSRLTERCSGRQGIHWCCFVASSSRTDTPVDKMMSSGAAPSPRPASAPGEDAPLANAADRNEVNVSGLFACHLTAAAPVLVATVGFFRPCVTLNPGVFLSARLGV